MLARFRLRNASLLALILSLGVEVVQAQTETITTFAGNGTQGFSGDGLKATLAELDGPTGVAVDSSGNVFIADSVNNRVRRVDHATQIISTVAGNGIAGYTGNGCPANGGAEPGDGGAATAACLSNPYGVAVDAGGNIFIADFGNGRIRKVDTSGTITTVAGGGLNCPGDGLPATSACLVHPIDVTVDGTGNLFIADSTEARIREVFASNQIIVTVAGNGFSGYSGDGGLATSAMLNDPSGVALDSQGNVYIGDYGNSRVREVTVSTGNITTVAGNGTFGYVGGTGLNCPNNGGADPGDGGAATSACVNGPSKVSVAQGQIFIADTLNERVRVVKNGIIQTFAGGSGSGFLFCGDGGPATQACLYNPTGVAAASVTNVYIADASNNRIRYVFPSNAGALTAKENSCCNPSEPMVSFSAGSAGDPINTAFGTFSETFADLYVGGRGLPLTLAHSYNSVFAGTNGPLGYGWTHSYNMQLNVNASGVVTINQENGSQVVFTPTSGGSYSAPPRTIATLTRNNDDTYSFMRRAQTFFTFSSGGQLLSESDRNGYLTTLTYNSSGQLATVTEPAGRVLSFTYNGSHLASVTDPLGRSVNFAYDSNGNLATVTDVMGKQTKFTYSAGHLLLTMTDPRGGIVSNTYNSAGQVTSQSDQLGRKTTLAYGSGTTTITDPKGNKVQEQYNQLHQRTALVRGFGTAAAATWRFAYDPNTMAITTGTDPNGHMSSATYDAAANPLQSTDALSRVTSRTWDTNNDLLSITDPLGITTHFTYDNNGNPLSQSTPLGGTNSTQTYTYKYGDSAHPGDVTSIIDPNGKTTTFAYDASGNPVKVIDPLGHSTTFSHNIIGWVTAITDARGKSTSFRYDNLGEILQVTDPLGHTIKRSFDPNQNLISVTDATGHVTTFTYDKANQRTKTTRPNGIVLQGVYNADGTVNSLVDGAGHSTIYSYTPLGRLASVTDPLGRTARFTYDPAGNQLTFTDAAGNITTGTYDAADQLVSISYSDGKTPTVTFVYDADGQRSSMNDGTGTSSWAIDSLHRVTGNTNGSGAAVSYAYDLKGNLTKVTYPGGIHIVNRSYDAADRLISVTDWLGNKTIFTYDGDGNLSKQTLPATTGIVESFSYDAAGHLSGITDTKAAATLAKYTYTRNGAGRLVATSEMGVPLAGTDSYTYSSINQLSAVNSSTYSYDDADNITGIITPSQVQLQYDSGNELTSLSMGTQKTTFNYDMRGNRLKQTPPTGAASTYQYDQANRLATFGTAATYAYDGDGLRTLKTVSSSAESIIWQRNGDLPAILVDGTNSYVYGADGLPLEQISSSGSVLYYLRDQVGSTRLLTSTSGAVQAAYTYDAYGNLLANTGTVANPFRYAGQYTDAESGLIYLRARYYDPSTAQFITRDPLLNSVATVPPYGYADHDPLNENDLSGLDGVINLFPQNSSIYAATSRYASSYNSSVYLTVAAHGDAGGYEDPATGKLGSVQKLVDAIRQEIGNDPQSAKQNIIRLAICHSGEAGHGQPALAQQVSDLLHKLGYSNVVEGAVGEVQYPGVFKDIVRDSLGLTLTQPTPFPVISNLPYLAPGPIRSLAFPYQAVEIRLDGEVANPFAQPTNWLHF
jgi:RHS repeat-associated protein